MSCMCNSFYIVDFLQFGPFVFFYTKLKIRNFHSIFIKTDFRQLNY